MGNSGAQSKPTNTSLREDPEGDELGAHLRILWVQAYYQGFNDCKNSTGLNSNHNKDDSVAYSYAEITALLTAKTTEAFKQGQRVGQYQAADKLYGYVTTIYLFKDGEDPKLREHADAQATGLLKDCEKFMNHNAKAYKEYLKQLQQPDKEEK